MLACKCFKLPICIFLTNGILSTGNDLKTGIYITCIDGKMRVYYPIILLIMADYKEQVVIIGIKNLRQYTIC